MAKSVNVQAIPTEYMTKWNSLYSLIKKHGILKFSWLGFQYILRKTIRLHWENTIMFERSLEEPIQEIVPRVRIRVAQATEDDLDKFKGIVDEDKRSRFKQRFEEGRICFVALDGKKVVAFTWLSLENEYEPDLQIEIKLNDEEAYFFDTYVLPEYRHNRLQSTMMAAKLMYLHHQACKRVISLVWDKNTYSIKALVSAGFRPKKAVTNFTILGLKFHRWQKYTGTLPV